MHGVSGSVSALILLVSLLFYVGVSSDASNPTVSGIYACCWGVSVIAGLLLLLASLLCQASLLLLVFMLLLAFLVF
jgi:hypothetical protein